MMVNGKGVGFMYATIIDGRRDELIAQGISGAKMNEQMSAFAVEVKHYPREDFDLLYQLYKGTVRAKPKRTTK